MVETGTFLGNTIKAVKNEFKEIYSIELDRSLYIQAKNRFKKFKHINIKFGDSSEKLPEILSKIESQCLFWLDAHYSGKNTSKTEVETPIINELRCIINHPIKNHIILIDDANKFTGQNDYPTIKEIKKMYSHDDDKMIYINDNIIIIHNKSKF